MQFQYTLSEYTLKGERKATLKLDPNIDYVIQVIAREDKGDVGIDYKYSDMVTSQSTNSLRLHTNIQTSSYSKIDLLIYLKIWHLYLIIYNKGERFFKKFSFKLCTNSISTLFLKKSARIPRPSAFALWKVDVCQKISYTREKSLWRNSSRILFLKFYWQ